MLGGGGGEKSTYYEREADITFDRQDHTNFMDPATQRD